MRRRVQEECSMPSLAVSQSPVTALRSRPVTASITCIKL